MLVDALCLQRNLARHEQVATRELDDCKLAAIEFDELRRGAVDATDLVAVRKMPRRVGVGGVERLRIEQVQQLLLALALFPGNALDLALCRFALVLLLLRAQCVSVREVELVRRRTFGGMGFRVLGVCLMWLARLRCLPACGLRWSRCFGLAAGGASAFNFLARPDFSN